MSQLPLSTLYKNGWLLTRSANLKDQDSEEAGDVYEQKYANSWRALDKHVEKLTDL